MHALDVLGDPVRRRILRSLLNGDMASGDIVEIVSQEFGITQPAVSHQLKVLRENGFANVRPEAQRRVYSLNANSFLEVQGWLEPFAQYWDHKLDALDTEIARGKKNRNS